MEDKNKYSIFWLDTLFEIAPKSPQNLATNDFPAIVVDQTKRCASIPAKASFYEDIQLLFVVHTQPHIGLNFFFIGEHNDCAHHPIFHEADLARPEHRYPHPVDTVKNVQKGEAQKPKPDENVDLKLLNLHAYFYRLFSIDIISFLPFR